MLAVKEYRLRPRRRLDPRLRTCDDAMSSSIVTTVCGSGRSVDVETEAAMSGPKFPAFWHARNTARCVAAFARKDCVRRRGSAVMPPMPPPAQPRTHVVVKQLKCSTLSWAVVGQQMVATTPPPPSHWAGSSM